MSHFFTLIKMNMKLLLRNKGFLFFLCVIPVVSVCILNLKMTATEPERGNAVAELDKVSAKAVYVADTTKYIVKVYDAAGSDLSEYIMENLADTGMFSMCRCRAENMTEREAFAQAKTDAYEDRAGVILYLKKDFDEGVMEGDWNRAIQIYHVSEDERFELFEENLKEIFTAVFWLSDKTGSENLMRELSRFADRVPDKKVIMVSGKDEIALDSAFGRCRDRVGYSFAIVTLGFLFCGVYIAYTVMEEQENKVYTRIMLSKAGRYEYLLAKLVISFMIAVLQTGVIGIYLLLLANMDFGMQMSDYLFMVFLLGIIFNILSLCVGVLMGDVMGANYAVFTIWSISGLLSGLYFSLDSSSTVIKAASYLMPQKWFLRGAEMLIMGDKSVYSMLICITAAYLIVILSVGAAGLRIRKND